MSKRIKERIYYRVTDTLDPEERLEDACLWKALHDEFGDGIAVLPNSADVPEDGVFWGRGKRFKREASEEETLDYWADFAFLSRAGRSFKVLSFDDAALEVARLHGAGRAAFLKSIRRKQFLAAVPTHQTWSDVVGDMAYSFIDGGPKLMVQEFVEMRFEHRFFVIDRRIVTHSPVAAHLTPLDRIPEGMEFSTPASVLPTAANDAYKKMHDLAQAAAREMTGRHACIDTAMTPGGPVVIEFNPMSLGNIGLFACDVRALANASRELITRLHRPDVAGAV